MTVAGGSRPIAGKFFDNGATEYHVQHPDYGAVANGSFDCMSAVTAAVNALPTDGGVVELGFGKLKLTGDGSAFSAAVNSKRNVIIRGRNGMGWRGNNAPPLPAATTVYWKDLTDYLYKKSGTTNESLRFENIAWDGSNGGGTANGTTTCPGLVASNGSYLYFFSAYNCVFTDSKYSHSAGTSGTTGRAVFDLALTVFPSFDHCFFGVNQNGRWIFTDTGSTTFRANRTYFTGAREIAYHRGTTGVCYNDCVFESSVVGVVSYLSAVRFTGKCHAENLGQNSGVAAWTTGLAPRNHGLGGAVGTLLSGNVNTAFNQLYGSTRHDGTVFNSLKPSGPYSSWYEALGVGTASGQGGSLVFDADCTKNDGGLTDSMFASTMAFGTAERGTEFVVGLEDGWGILPVGALINKAADARKVNTGYARIVMNDLVTFQLARIARGNFILDLQESGTALAAKPSATVYPRGDQWLRGDRIHFALPSSSLGAFALECTGSGTATPTWALLSEVRAPSVDRGDASVTLVALADQVVQVFATTLTANRTVTLPAPANSFARQTYRIVRTGLGAFTLTVQTSGAVALKAIPNSTAAFVDVMFSGASNQWILIGYGTL